jgi:uncharacterized membrane protein
MKKTIVLVVLCAGLLLMAQVSCKHQIPGIPIAPNDTVCFEATVLPLMQTSCAKSGCHDAVTRANGYQLDSYANITSRGVTAGNANSSLLYQVVSTNNPAERMPLAPNAPLTAAQQALIAKWINQGARNTRACGPVCDTATFTYNARVKPILQTYCYGCHSGDAINGAGIILDKYDELRAYVDPGFLLETITHAPGASPMPKGAAKLSDCNIAIISKWIAAGAPNN